MRANVVEGPCGGLYTCSKVVVSKIHLSCIGIYASSLPVEMCLSSKLVHPYCFDKYILKDDLVLKQYGVKSTSCCHLVTDLVSPNVIA